MEPILDLRSPPPNIQVAASSQSFWVRFLIKQLAISIICALHDSIVDFQAAKIIFPNHLYRIFAG